MDSNAETTPREVAKIDNTASTRTSSPSRIRGIGRFGTPNTVISYGSHGVAKSASDPDSLLPVSNNKAISDTCSSEPVSSNCCSSVSGIVSLKSVRPLLETLVKQKAESAVFSAAAASRGIGRFGKPVHVASFRSRRANRPFCFKPPQSHVHADSKAPSNDDCCNSVVFKSMRPLLANLAKEKETSSQVLCIGNQTLKAKKVQQSNASVDVKRRGIGRFRREVSACQAANASPSPCTSRAALPAVATTTKVTQAGVPPPAAAVALVAGASASVLTPAAGADHVVHKEEVPGTNSSRTSGNNPSSNPGNSSSSSKERVRLLRSMRSMVRDPVKERAEVREREGEPANRVADSHRSTRRRLKHVLMQLALQRVEASRSCEVNRTEVG
ncbi:hypothetical protein CLOM_g2977 [Closterium sp. NIES-68]|nr:hypothetical protein CLOM_g2977 [Closterium sp. NIES-68]GJP72660.1 hypothetical protein CLOP_g3426 [Closterium sp. NIES-67]